MSAPAVPPPSTDAVLDPCTVHLGHALALIHRALPRLDDAGAGSLDLVARALGQVILEVQSAQTLVRQRADAQRPVPVEPEVLALIAAAVSVVLQGAAHRVLDIRGTAPTVTWVNAWAIEGRFQHYSSHKVR